jgi:hypothetical protein
MYNSKAKWILAMAVTAFAIGALVVVGSGISSGIAQMSYPNTNTNADQNDANTDQNDNSTNQSWSGTLNSLVEGANDEKQIVGGEWTLSLHGNNVSEFSADIDMVSSDGTGAHTHRIVVSGGTIRAASAGNLEVTLVPTEQSAGKAVLLNVTGLAAGANVTIKMNDNNMGMADADENGNLLFALGTAESMIGPVNVSVEDGEGNSGSANLTVTEAETQNATGTSNTTESTTRTNSNLTGTNNARTNANETASSGDNSTATTGTNQNNTSGIDSSSDQPTYSIQTQIQSPTYGSQNTTLSTPMISNGTTSSTTGNDLTNSDRTNATDTTSNRKVTSFEDESSVVAQVTGNTTTFTTQADIYTNGELKWEDVEIAVTLTNGKVLSIEIDPEATDGHFGEEPIYGIVTLSADLYR